MTTRFGRYELLRPLGRGGMAEVFLARLVGPEGFEKRLVIKRVLPQLSDDSRLLRMFFEEARTHVSLSHGNLVSVFDFGRVGNDYFIAMEHVLGADLATLLTAEQQAGGTLPPALVACIGIELCRGLAYVHRRGFVHRDVSPRNILLSLDGEVKLSDFGLVLSATSDGSGVRGTLAYTSPEQARADRVDGRSDLYSLGIVLAEAVIGHPPRGAAGVVELLAVAREGAAITVGGPLSEVIARATATNQADRYHRAEDMLAALDRVVLGLGAGREDAVRQLAMRIAALPQRTPSDPAANPQSEIAVTEEAAPHATADLRGARGPRSAGAQQETYFRDHASASFVDEVLDEERSVGQKSRRWLRLAPVLLLFAIGVSYRVLHRGPEPAQPAQPAPAVTERSAAADLAVSRQSVERPTPIDPGPKGHAAQPRVAREATGIVHIECTPWCVPYVDGVVRAEGGRRHTLIVPVGRHLLEVRRLEDRREQNVQVRSDRPQVFEFDFKAKFD